MFFPKHVRLFVRLSYSFSIKAQTKKKYVPDVRVKINLRRRERRYAAIQP